MRMNLGELETVTTYNLPVKVIVLNNRGDGMVRQWQKLISATGSRSDKLATEGFRQDGRVDGFRFARRLTDKSRLEETLRNPRLGGPAFLRS